MLLEDTLAVPSLGKLFEDHGYSYHWTSGRKPQRNTANCVPIVVPGLSTNSSSSSSPTSHTSSSQDTVTPTQHPASTRKWEYEWHRKSTGRLVAWTSRNRKTHVSPSSQWRKRISKLSSIRCSVTILGNTLDPVASVQNKNSSGNTKGACKSSWSRIGNQKSFTLTNSWNLAKLVKIFPGIIVRQHHTDQKQMGLLKEQCAE